ncbi:maturin isoform X1 [Balearica regulorum gibbericeps]|uniref:maturin isoform X1 n=1 Tax=Balearica regulorum gibbericeps TaxID=100784 RepID=UPI003F63CD99
MAFEALAEAAERWCARTPFQLIAAEETERRMDFYAEPGVSFYVLCPEAACGDNFHVWSESEDCLPFLQLAQDYISSCGKKTLHEILEKVFKSFRPLLGLPDVDDDAFEEYNADVEEEEPEADHQQMGAVFQLDQSHHLVQRVAAQRSAGTTEGRVQGWTRVVAEDPQPKAPCTSCMVLGAGGGGADVI